MNIIIGIHPDQGSSESYSEKWKDFLLARGVEVRMLNLLASDALEQVRQCDGIMWRFTHKPQNKQSARPILYIIEHYLDIPVFPDWNTAWHYDDKIAQHYLLQTLQAPVPKTWLFWSSEEALSWVHTATYPVVFKLSSGAGSSNVIKVNSQAEASTLIRRIFNRGILSNPTDGVQPASNWFPKIQTRLKSNLVRLRDALRYSWWAEYPPLPPKWWQPEHGYAYFQQFLSENEFDTRIIVVGERAWACRRYNRPNDFRASGSGLIDFAPDHIAEDSLKLAFQIARRGYLKSAAFDILRLHGKPVIGEISYTFPQYKPWRDFPGYWHADLSWVEEQLWPEEAQVEDFLEQIAEHKTVSPLEHMSPISETV